MWEKASGPSRKKRFKVLFWGPAGCYKTRTILRLGNVEKDAEPVLAIVDLEFGTDHYKSQFNFTHNQELDPDIIDKQVKEILSNPNGFKILGFDGFSVYQDQVKDKFMELFLKREISSPGHKKDYYVLQPRDYDPINRQVYKLVKAMLKSDLHIFATCQPKDKWEGMKVTGKVLDGPKRVDHYFDTIIEIQESKKKGKMWEAFIRGKDRTGIFPPNTEIPWDNDKVAAEFLMSKWGDLTQGSVAEPVVEEKKEEKEEPKAEVKQAEEKKEDSNQKDSVSNAGPTDDDIRDLKMSIVKSKNSLAIRNMNDWRKMVREAAGVDSVNEMTIDQMVEFDKQLKEEVAKKNPT